MLAMVDGMIEDGHEGRIGVLSLGPETSQQDRWAGLVIRTAFYLLSICWKILTPNLLLLKLYLFIHVTTPFTHSHSNTNTSSQFSCKFNYTACDFYDARMQMQGIAVPDEEKIWIHSLSTSFSLHLLNFCNCNPVWLCLFMHYALWILLSSKTSYGTNTRDSVPGTT